VAVVVRRAVPADAHAIAAVHVASWQAGYAHVFPAEFLSSLSASAREPRWRTALSDAEELIFVAEDSGEVVGFASAAASRDEDAHDRSVGELHTIYVRADYWDTVAGSRLHDAAVDALQKAGFREATLWVLDSNTRARRFYERHAWTPDGAVKHDERGGTPIVEVRYRRHLCLD
jgi:ribosomal protein S18 acetylase RimI-like enzyme